MLKVVSSREVIISEKMKEKGANYIIIEDILSDEKAFAIQSDDFLAVQSVSKPMWVWMNDEVGSNEFEDMIREFLLLVGDKSLSSIIGEKEIVYRIANMYCSKHMVEYSAGMSMKTYICKGVNSNSYFEDGISLIKAKNIHRDIIANFLAEENLTTQDEEILSIANKLIDTDDLYLLDSNNAIVAMAYVAQRTPIYARITGVFVPTEHRLQGYATKLIAHLSQTIIEQGLIPMLFTNESNDVSNHVYKNVGYHQVGTMQNIRFSNVNRK